MLTIRKPCHENWNEMTPKEKGRLCDKCCKVVVDFTQKTTSQIIEFLETRTAEKVCGRFRAEHVRVPVQSGRPSRMRIFLAALYLVFGGLLFSSCHTAPPREPERMGRVSTTQSFTHYNSVPDTVRVDSTIKKGKKNSCPRPETEVFKMGDVEYVPVDTSRNK